MLQEWNLKDHNQNTTKISNGAPQNVVKTEPQDQDKSGIINNNIIENCKKEEVPCIKTQ